MEIWFKTLRCYCEKNWTISIMEKRWYKNTYNIITSTIELLLSAEIIFRYKENINIIISFQIVDNHVIKYTEPENYNPMPQPKFINRPNRFGCILIGAESTDPSKFTKEYCTLFKNSGVMPKNIISRFTVSPQAALLPGTPINVTHFRVGDFVDVKGKT